jgi:hypothetical protein
VRSSTVGPLVVFAMACSTGAVIAVGGDGSSSQSASQSQYKPPNPPGPPPGKPPCVEQRPPVPSVDKRCPLPPPGNGRGFDSFFDVFFEVPPFDPPPPRPPVPSVDPRFSPPGPPRGKGP